MAGGDNADRIIFRWVNLNTDFGVFSKESREKVYWLPSLLILFFIVVPCQSTHSCGCEWLGACRYFLQSDKLKGGPLNFCRKKAVGRV